MKDISKQYPQLTADERFRLFVAAMGRKDEQELDRLENTCPRRQYSMQDYAYTTRKMRFMVFAMASALEWLRADLFAAVAFGLAMTFDSKDTADGDERSESLVDSFRKFMNVRDGKRQGWRRFCEELGVDANGLAAPFTEHVVTMEHVLDSAYETSRELTDDLDAEERQMQEIADAEYSALAEAWADSVRG